MPTTHHVTAGGPELVIARSDDLTVTKFSVGRMDNNVYLLRHRDGSTVLIDAAADARRIADVVGGVPDVVVTTHRHHDHIGALAAVVGNGSPRLYAGAPDADAIAAATGVTGITGVWDGDEISCGGIRLGVAGLVGHTPGSIVLVCEEPGIGALLFTGDGLFPGGPGRVTSPEDFMSLMDDLETKVFDRFGDDAAVHPGHGDSTTLGAERPQLSAWRDRGW